MQVITHEELKDLMVCAKEHTKDVASDTRRIEISLINWAAVTAMKKLLSMLDRHGWVIVRRDSPGENECK